MRPEAKVWRKHQRAATKGIPTGPRTGRPVETQEPTPRATGYACQVGWCASHDATRRSAVYACDACWAGIERLTAIYQQEAGR